VLVGLVGLVGGCCRRGGCRWTKALAHYFPALGTRLCRAIYRDITRKRPYIAIIVLGPIEKVIGLLRPYTLFIIAKYLISALIIEGLYSLG